MHPINEILIIKKITNMKKFNRLGAIILLSLLPVFSFAQQNVRGVVLDSSTQQPLVGATVLMLAGEGLLDVTDSQGKFTIYGVPSGRRDVIVSMRGFRAYVGSIFVYSEEEVVLTVCLEENPPIFSELISFEIEFATTDEIEFHL